MCAEKKGRELTDDEVRPVRRNLVELLGNIYNDGEISLETAVKQAMQYGIADEADFLRRTGLQS